MCGADTNAAHVASVLLRPGLYATGATTKTKRVEASEARRGRGRWRGRKGAPGPTGLRNIARGEPQREACGFVRGFLETACGASLSAPQRKALACIRDAKGAKARCPP